MIIRTLELPFLNSLLKCDVALLQQSAGSLTLCKQFQKPDGYRLSFSLEE